MFHLSHILFAVKQAVIRGVAGHFESKLPNADAHTVERKHLTVVPWLNLDPVVWPCALTDQNPVASSVPGASAIGKSSDSPLCSSPPTSSVIPTISSENKSSTVTVLALPPLSIPKLIISDYDAEKAGCGSAIEWEYRDMFLKKKVTQFSESKFNALVGEDSKTLGFLAPPGAFSRLKRKKRVTPRRTAEQWPHYGPLPVPSPGGFVVVAPATTHGGLRTTAKSLTMGPGMYHYKTLAKWMAEQTYRTSYEGMTFASKFYTQTIRDQFSFDAWLEWKAKRPMEERVLWVVG